MNGMNKMNYAYCSECEDLVEFIEKEEWIEEEYKGQIVKFQFKVGRCMDCGQEVATDLEYITRRTEAKIEAYKKQNGIILEREIKEILEKYNIGKENLSEIAGFGKVTIKRYFAGYIPSKEYSDILYRILDDEEFFIEMMEENRHKINERAIQKVSDRLKELKEIKNSKTQQVVNYIITNMEEVTPLGLQKLLAFSQGVNYALNKSRLLSDQCQAWQHGYVYPSVYGQYKNFRYGPIDNGISSTHGCMLSKVTTEEIKAIDLVIKTFGLYSPKTLELISHKQKPWKEKRNGYLSTQPGNETVDEESLKDYFIENHLNTEENILSYIMKEIRK